MTNTTATHAAEFRRLIRNRIVELGITYGTVDVLAGLPDRYCSKILCDPPARRMSIDVLCAVLGALALAPRFESDDRRLAQLRQRHDWKLRELDGPQYMPREVAG